MKIRKNGYLESTYPEDNSHSSGDIGTFTLGVRNDARAARTGSDGDYSPISTDQYGSTLIAYPIGTFNNGVSTTVAGTAIIISSASATTIRVLVQNTGLAPMAVGVAGVTATTGFILNSGGWMIFEKDDGCENDIYAIRTTATSTTALTQKMT